MAAHILALTHGLLGFKLATVIFLVPMLVGLIRQRASLGHCLFWPLVAAPERGDRGIIADPDGGYLARFYAADRGDVILNPFDGDAHKWDLFGEITNDYDVEQLARSLIPDSGASDRTWSQYARTFFSAVVQQAIVADARNDAELYRLVTSA